MTHHLSSRLWPVLALALAVVMPSPAAGQVVEYYHLDALGSVRAVTNQAGQVVERHDYLPFGEECTTPPCATTLPGTNTFKFTGKERDPESGLDYFGARYYGAKPGRFLTVDPVLNAQAAIADPQRWNRYAYTSNNPLSRLDPDGRDWYWKNGNVPVWVVPDCRGVYPAPPGPGWKPFVPGDWPKPTQMRLDVDYMDGIFTLGVDGAGDPILSYRTVGLEDRTMDLMVLTQPLAGALRAGGSAGGSVVIGESMARVTSASGRLGAQTFTTEWTTAARVMRANMSWLRSQIANGRTIYDIGMDTSRPMASKFYEAELALLKDAGLARMYVGKMEIQGQMRAVWQWVLE